MYLKYHIKNSANTRVINPVAGRHAFGGEEYNYLMAGRHAVGGEGNNNLFALCASRSCFRTDQNKEAA